MTAPTSEASKAKRKSSWIWGLRLLLGVSLLVALVLSADPSEILSLMRRVSLGWLAAMVIVPHLGMVLSSIKWHALLRCHGSRVRLATLVRLYFVGTFFNNFLPTMIGGDVVRAAELAREEPRRPLVIASTFLERFIGLAGLVALLPLAALEPRLVERIPALPLLTTGAVLAFALLTAMLFSGMRIPAEIPLPVRIGILDRILRALRGAQEQLLEYRQKPGVLFVSWIISVVFYLAAGLTVWLATRAVGADAPLGFVVAITPLVLLAAIVPISVNGLGILESGYVLLLTMGAVEVEQAASVALLLRMRILLTAIFGGILFLGSRHGTPPASKPASGPVPKPVSKKGAVVVETSDASEPTEPGFARATDSR